ncbi:MAG TPA: hypothetical protein VJL31_10610 [Gemmatimonadales bacterium]|jgi:hypothetical protein|nr:hypothetical protein [Gemmatimonadales bacterium]
MLLLLGFLAGAVPLQGQGPTIQLRDDEARNVFLVTVGPLEMPASHGADHESHAGVFPPVTSVQVPRASYLYGFDYEVRDGAGRLLPRDLLHHVNIADPTHRELFLPIAHRVFAIGRETGAQSMPRMLLGHPLTEGQELLVSAMMHNPTHESYAGVTLTLLLKYVPASRPWPLFRVYTWQMDVAFPAGDKSFDLPPGPFSRSYEARPSVPGRLMVIAGHLHPYATSIRFEDVTAGKLIWEGKPIGRSAGELEGVTMGRLYRKLGVKIEPDHTYRVTVSYDNPTDRVIPDGGMGVVGGLFLPAGDVEWPAADPTDELYRLDLMHYRRELTGKYADLLAAFKGSTVDGESPVTHRH